MSVERARVFLRTVVERTERGRLQWRRIREWVLRRERTWSENAEFRTAMQAGDDRARVGDWGRISLGGCGEILDGQPSGHRRRHNRIASS